MPTNLGTIKLCPVCVLKTRPDHVTRRANSVYVVVSRKLAAAVVAAAATPGQELRDLLVDMYSGKKRTDEAAALDLRLNVLSMNCVSQSCRVQQHYFHYC